MTSSTLSHTFDNGLVLVAEPIASLRSAAFTMLVPAGCANEPDELSGLGGFTCEMALRGAGERDSRQFILDLENLGVNRHESVQNIHAGFSGAMLAENLPEALAIYADLLRRPHLPPEQIEASRSMMFQELRAVEDEPAHKLMLELRRCHYPRPWNKSPHGSQPGVEAIGIEQVRTHFSRYYRPGGTIIGVAGHFDWKQLKDTVERLLGDWEPQELPSIVESPAGPRYDHLPYDSNQTHVGIGYASVPYRDPDYFQAWGAVGVLSGGSSSRLFTEVRERRGLCYSINASQHTLKDVGAVLCYVGTSADRARETLDITLAEIERLAEGIEEQELDRLKARIKSALIMQQESSHSRSATLARDWYHLGRARTLEEVGRIIDELSSRSINAYLEKHPPDDFTIVTLGPEKLETPGGIS